MFLHQPGDGIDIARTPRTPQRGPGALRLAGGGNCGVHIALGGLAQGCQHLAGGGVFAVESITRRGEFAIDEMAKPVPHVDQPGKGVSGAFGGRSIVHGLENLFDCHLFSPWIRP